MSNVNYTVRQGDTELLNFTLQSAGSAANITGYGSVSMFLISKVDSATTLLFSTGGAADLTVVTAASGACTISPEETDFLNSKSPYHGYVIVVDGSGKRASFPEDGELIFTVLKRLSNDGS